MTYGGVYRPLPVVIFLLAFLCSLALGPLPALARPVPASELTVTLLSTSDKQLQVQSGDGRAFAVKIAPTTWLLRRGLVVAPREMTPGEMLRVRLGRGKGGAALLVCDAETADAIASHRRRPLSGTVVDAGGKVWTVQPADSAVPLPVCLSPRTLFRAGGSPVAASAFGTGAAVTITTRGLANGLLAAVSVLDGVPNPLGLAAEHGSPASRSVSGIIVEARPDLGLLTLQDTAGASQTIAVDAATRVKSGGRSALLGDMTAGMRVRIRLGEGQDTAGNPVAASVSASAGKSAQRASKRKQR